MFLVGDAGNAQLDKVLPALKFLQNKLQAAPTQSSILFLSDNIYPNGMPPKEDKAGRADAEGRINAQLDLLKNFKGRPIFLPGESDWGNYGLASVKREGKYIEKCLNAGTEDKKKMGGLCPAQPRLPRL